MAQKSQITTAVVLLVMAVVGFMVVNAFGTANITYTLYAHNDVEPTLTPIKLLNLTAPVNNTDVWITLDVTSAAAQNVSIGVSFAIPLAGYRMTGIPDSTWKFWYRAVANVTDKSKLYMNMTLVDATGTHVAFLEEYSGLSGLITAANATYYAIQSVGNYTTDFVDTLYLKVEPYVQTVDVTSVQVKLLVDGYPSTDTTRLNGVVTYEVLPAGLQLLLSLVWLIAFASIALFVLLKGLAGGKE